MRFSPARIPVTGLLLTPALFAAESAAPARRFAAPDAAASLPSGGVGGIGQVILALVLVLVAVFVVAVLVKRLRGFAAVGAHSIEILAQTSLGAKERAVIVRVGDTRLLLGVASGQVSLLQTLPPELPVSPAAGHPAEAQRPTFANLLKRSLGR